VLSSSIHALHARCNQLQQRVLPEVHLLEDAAAQHRDGGAERARGRLPQVDMIWGEEADLQQAKMLVKTLFKLRCLVRSDAVHPTPDLARNEEMA
jgi:hypothetical protein